VLLARAVEVNDLAQGALRRVAQWPWIEHPTFQLRDGHFITELLPPQFVSCHLHTFIEFQNPFQLSRYKKPFTVYGNLILSVGFPGDFRVLLKHSSQNPKQFRITVLQLK